MLPISWTGFRQPPAETGAAGVWVSFMVVVVTVVVVVSLKLELFVSLELVFLVGKVSSRRSREKERELCPRSGH